jgi:outer membrane protein assembly factor BamA
MAAEGRPYSPWPTLAPTWWSPFVEGNVDNLSLGVTTGGTDALGYHAYAANAAWLVSHPTDVPRRVAHPNWRASYSYNRWQPALWASASSDTSFFPDAADTLRRSAALRRRQLELGVSLPIQRVRLAQATIWSFVAAEEQLTSADGRTVTERLNAGRAAWSVNSAHTYGYSISREHGARVGATAELARGGSAIGTATSVTADGRVYLPSLRPHHVVALRLAAGTSRGDPAIGRTFSLGGPTQSAAILSFDRRAISLLRGFAADSFAGRNVVLLNAEYRWPIARPQRGVGTFPLFIHTVHASLFGDAGRAWNGTLRLGDVQSSVGGELSFKVTAGYALPLTATIGAALARDGNGRAADRKSFYVRLGQAF